MYLVGAAIIFGAMLIVAGILGFVPAIAPEGMLFRIFHVNAAHNVVHLLSGAAAIAAAVMGPIAARHFFRIFAVLYGAIAFAGLFVGDGYLFGFIAHNSADFWLHTLIAVVSAALGVVTSVDQRSVGDKDTRGGVPRSAVAVRER